MNGVSLFMMALALSAAPTEALSLPGQPEDAAAIDLSGDLAADVLGIDARARRYEADIYPCGRLADAMRGHSLLGTIRAGAVFFSRDRAQAEPSSKIFSVTNNALLLDAANLELGTAVGLDVTLIVAIGPSSQMEVRYFGLDGWNTSQTAIDPGGVRFEGFGITAAAQAARVDYASRLYSVEANIRPRVATIPLIFGFRTIQVHERFEMYQIDPQSEVVGVSTRTNNFLYGGQIGAEPLLLDKGTLAVEGAIKAGIYGNVASQCTAFPLADATVDARRTPTSFVGELSLTGVYRFTKSISARGGYELLWIRGLALAPDQSGSTQFLPLSATVNTSAISLYQGAFASLEFQF